MPPWIDDPSDRSQSYSLRLRQVTDPSARSDFSITAADLEPIQFTTEIVDGEMVVKRVTRLQEGDPMPDDHPTIDTWILEHVQGRTPTGRIYGWFADGGLNNIRRRFLRDTSQDIQYHIDAGASAVRAFNRATGEFPSEIRALVAAYEADNPAGSRPEDYLDDVRDYAEDAGQPEWDDAPEIETYYADNLAEEAVLSSAERSAIMFLRASHESISEAIAEDIDNPSGFEGRYADVGDLDAALNLQHYDHVLPENGLRHLASPDDWPEGDDAGDVLEERCRRCGDRWFYVYTDDGEWTWLNEHGDVDDNCVHTGLDDNVEAINGGSPFMCAPCRDHSQAHNPLVVYATDGDTTVARNLGDGVLEHDRDDSVLIDDLSLHDVDNIHAAINGSIESSGFFSVIFHDDFGDVSTQINAAHEVLTPPVDVEGGPAILLRYSSGPSHLFLPREDPDVAEAVKTEIAEIVNEPTPA